MSVMKCIYWTWQCKKNFQPHPIIHSSYLLYVPVYLITTYLPIFCFVFLSYLRKERTVILRKKVKGNIVT